MNSENCQYPLIELSNAQTDSGYEINLIENSDYFKNKILAFGGSIFINSNFQHLVVINDIRTKSTVKLPLLFKLFRFQRYDYVLEFRIKNQLTIEETRELINSYLEEISDDLYEIQDKILNCSSFNEIVVILDFLKGKYLNR